MHRKTFWWIRWVVPLWPSDFCSVFFLIIGTTPRNPFQLVNPWKWTWNPKIPPWKRRNIYKPPIFGFHVNFSGAYYIFVSRKRCFATKRLKKQEVKPKGWGGGWFVLLGTPKKTNPKSNLPKPTKMFFSNPHPTLNSSPRKIPTQSIIRNPWAARHCDRVSFPTVARHGSHPRWWWDHLNVKVDKRAQDQSCWWGVAYLCFLKKMAEFFGKNTTWVLPKHWKCLVDSEGEWKAP